MGGRVRREVKQMRAASVPLTASCGLMLVLLAVAVVGLWVDPRVITGAPAWSKPLKFAVSSALYTGTLAWLLRYVTIRPRLVQAIGWVLGVAVALEVVLIDVQAARGTTSHFNFATKFDGTVFTVMAGAIALLLVASAGLTAVLFRQRFADPAWGWALRLGMLLTVLGSSLGGLMTRPTPEQMNGLRAGKTVAVIGAHTVGAPDGGAGMPGTGWSTRHGDLRIPHFFGLHGVQAVPLFAWWALRKRRKKRTGAVIWFAASYAGFLAVLVWQALRGESVTEPEGLVMAMWAVWVAAVVLGWLHVRGLRGRIGGVKGQMAVAGQ